MAVNQLRMFPIIFSCFFMICKTIANDLEGSYEEMHKTNEIINNIPPGKRTLIFFRFVLTAKYGDMADILFPPDLSTIDKSQYGYHDWIIMENEIRLQKTLYNISVDTIEDEIENVDFEDDNIEDDVENEDLEDNNLDDDIENEDFGDAKIENDNENKLFEDDEIEDDIEKKELKDDELESNFDNKDFKADSILSYEEELDKRKRLLLPVMQRLLHKFMAPMKMCYTDTKVQSKCQLVALIMKCNDNRRLIKKAKCVDDMCIVRETIRDEENNKKSRTVEHRFYDMEDINKRFYTYFIDSDGITRPWIEIILD